MSIEQYIESHLGCKISDKKTISSGETSSFKILTNTGLSIFAKYHLDNMNYRMPIHFINCKKTILNTLKNFGIDQSYLDKVIEADKV